MKLLKKRKEQEELQNKFRDPIFVQYKDAKNVMGLKGLFSSILSLNIHNYISQDLFININLIHNHKDIDMKINDDFLLININKLEYNLNFDPNSFLNILLLLRELIA